jgi:hypothetical protein
MHGAALEALRFRDADSHRVREMGRPKDQLITDAVISGAGAGSVLPRLDAFDQEFGCEPEEIAPDEELPKTKPRIWTFVGLAVTAAIISALAVTWSGDGGPFRLEVAPSSEAPAADASKDQIDRLTRQIEALKQEIRELTEAQHQAASTIAILKAAEQEARSAAAAYWYSDLTALHFGVPTQVQEPDVIATPSRRPMTARPEVREFRRRENGSAPLSLEAPQ